jgi:hypothetical protein
LSPGQDSACNRFFGCAIENGGLLATAALGLVQRQVGMRQQLYHGCALFLKLALMISEPL